MKKLLLLSAVALFFSGMVSAQDDSKMWVGGSLAIGSQKAGDVTKTAFGFAPEFGYNLNSEWAVGGRLGIISTTTKIDGTKIDNQSSSSTAFTPFVRYTFSQMGDFSFFGQGEIPLTFSDGNDTVGLKFLPGVTYSMGNWGIQALLPAMLAFESGDGYTDFGISVNTNILNNSSLGLIYKF